MDRSTFDGFMAVVAASGSVVFLALQVHKRLLSDFMKKLELEIGNIHFSFLRIFSSTDCCLNTWIDSHAHDSSVHDQISQLIFFAFDLRAGFQFD